jgi:uncharacterized protein YecT (DUF1311 family)
LSGYLRFAVVCAAVAFLGCDNLGKSPPAAVGSASAGSVPSSVATSGAPAAASVASAPSAPAAAAGPSASASASKAASAHADGDDGGFVGKYVGDTGSVEVTPGAAGRYQVHFALVAAGLPNSGEAGGPIGINDGSATLKISPTCKLAMKFGAHGTLEVSQTGTSVDCGFGMNVTADGSYKLEKRVAKAHADVNVPGAPSEQECAQLKPASAAGSTQLAINEAAADGATREGCRMRTAYTRLLSSVGSKPGVGEKLHQAQEAWAAYSKAHEGEVFPHEDEGGHYGSMLGMCVANETSGAYRARAAELRAARPCKDSAADAEAAQRDAHRAEVAAADALRKVKSANAKDAQLGAALSRAQVAFKKYAAAQGEFATAASGGNDACGARETERLAKQRASELKVLQKSGDEADCVWP